MSLQREVVYLEKQHLTKVAEVQRALGLKNKSDAVRRIIDVTEADQVVSSGELKALMEQLDAEVKHAEIATERALTSIARAERYFRETNNGNDRLSKITT